MKIELTLSNNELALVNSVIAKIKGIARFNIIEKKVGDGILRNANGTKIASFDIADAFDETFFEVFVRQVVMERILGAVDKRAERIGMVVKDIKHINKVYGSKINGLLKVLNTALKNTGLMLVAEMGLSGALVSAKRMLDDALTIGLGIGRDLEQLKTFTDHTTPKRKEENKADFEKAFVQEAIAIFGRLYR